MIAPALPPAILTPPTVDARLQKSIVHRKAGIAMVVVGNVIQFAGVSMLLSGLFHGADDGRFPAGKLAAAGGVLVGLGNVVEGVGWPFLIRGKMERDRLRWEKVRLDPRTAINED